MATTTYGSPYVANTDLVSAWPGVSLNVAQRVDAVSYAGNGINAQTGTTYTLVLTDAGKNVTLSNASSVTVTIPANSSVAYPTGTRINFTNLGAGTVTIAAAGGVTLNGSPLTLAQYTDGSILKLATDTWVFTSAPVATTPGLLQVTPTSIANTGGSASLSGGAVTFSGVTNVSLNGIFSATYDNYRVAVNITSGSTGGYARLRNRISGTDATTNYSYAVVYGTKSTAAGNATFASDSTFTDTTSMLAIDFDATVGGQAFLEVGRPFDAKPTYFATPYNKLTASSISGYIAGMHSTSTSYDGLTLLSSAGTMTGTIRVYGYRNS